MEAQPSRRRSIETMQGRGSTRRSHLSVTVSAVDWLLASEEPVIVAQATRDPLDELAPAEAARVLDGP